MRPDSDAQGPVKSDFYTGEATGFPPLVVNGKS